MAKYKESGIEYQKKCIARAEELNKKGIRLHQALSMAMDGSLIKDVPILKSKKRK